MITVKPFKAVRPTRDKAYLVATRSYLSYSEERLGWKLENNPFTFLHVINPDHTNNGLSQEERFHKVKDRFNEFCKERILFQEDEECLYIYQQRTESHVFTGIIGAVSTDDYDQGKVKKHEHTLEQRENLFASYLNETGFNAEPVLLFHKPLNTIAEVKNKYLYTRAEYEFTSTDNILHLFWPITDKEDISTIQKAYNEIDEMYIADGHHRCASSSRLAHLKNEEGYHNYFMAFMITDNNIKIKEFNRVVKDLNGYSKSEFLKEIEKSFFMRYIPSGKFEPSGIHEIGMFIENDWYSLYPKPGIFAPEDPVEMLDCHIISNSILSTILGITDERNDPRVSFIPGSEDSDKLEELIKNESYKVAFKLFPVSIDHLKSVADAGMFMPPKSTYIEPKLRSGLTIYKFD